MTSIKRKNKAYTQLFEEKIVALATEHKDTVSACDQAFSFTHHPIFLSTY